MSEILKPWYAAATPHEDIREGRLDESVFAANLWSVVSGDPETPAVYRDPEEFFRKTFMTAGLATVLQRVAGVLQGGADSGDRSVGLQTSFGGGKTHTLLSLWHLAKHGEKLRKSPAGEPLRRILGDRFPEKVKGVAVFTNNTCDSTQGRKTPEGIHTHTLWGELALQLGGTKLYEKIRANDESQRVPQGLFADILKEAAPCLILLDELADYCVGAATVPVGKATLADQTISFVQQLNDAIQQVPGVMLVATLPASKYEVAHSEEGQEVFTVLEKRFVRQGSDLKPVADDEIYDVVRTRLFESVTQPDEEDYPQKVAEAYQKMYATHSGEVPPESVKANFAQQMVRAYPFHPTLIDAFYKRWGSHPDFQRTRGVLRLLGSIIEDLWRRRSGNTQTQHFIQPSHIRWSVDPLQGALTRLWGQGYQSVAAADVLGDESNAALFDEERGGDYRREGIAQGLASAILLGSFGGKADRAGFSTRELKLSCSRVGLNWNYLDSALLELENRCSYLHPAAAGSSGKRYWFSTKANLNQLVTQHRQQFAGENFNEEILEAFKEKVPKTLPGGATWKVVVDPGTALPEQKSLTLVVLSPEIAWGEDEISKELVRKKVLEISKRCGVKGRDFPNTLIFLVANNRGLNKLRQAFREKSALEAVKSNYGDQLGEQMDDLNKRLDAATKASQEGLGPAFSIALQVEGQEVINNELSDARNDLTQHLNYVWETLVDDEWILKRVGGITLQKTGLIPKEGAISVRDAIEVFLKFTDKPMIASREAVTTGLVQACKDGLIGIGRGLSPSNLQSRYCRQSVSIDFAEEGVWITPPFAPEASKEVVTGAAAGLAHKSSEPQPTEASAGGSTTVPAGAGNGTAAVSVKIHQITIAGNVPLDNYSELFRCFIGPAAKMNAKKLRIGVDFRIEFTENDPIDQNDSRIKAMKEAARQLGLDFGIRE